MPISIAEVDQAEASLLSVKADAQADRNERTLAAVEQAKVALVQIRQAWRAQEMAAGNRTGTVGGDAVLTEGA